MEHIWRVLWLLFPLVAASATGARRGVPIPTLSLKPPLLDRMHSKTTYSCEGGELHVGCEEGKVIRLIRANYGRFSISICNDNGRLHWSVNCMSYRSFLIMQDRCSQKPSCGIGVSSTIFGDPCPGTLKYLEVQYQCVLPSFFTSTTRKSTVFTNTSASSEPETLPDTTVDTAAPSESPDVTAPVTSLISSTLPPMPVTKKFLPQSVSLVTTTAEPSTTELTTVTVPSTSEAPSNHCPPLVMNDIYWNWTRAGTQAIHRCPGGATGLARWHCGEEPVRWTSPHPDLRECRSVWVDNLRKRVENGESVISVATELALMTYTKSLYADDLKDVAEIIRQTLSRAINGMENFLDMWHRYHVLRELLQSLLETISNLLEQDQSAWKDLTISDRRRVASSLLDGLEESAMLLAESSGQDDSFTLAETNVLLSVQVLNARTLTSVQFPMPDDFRGDTGETAWIRMEDTLIIPAQALLDISKHGLAKVVFVVYSRVGDILKPEPGFLPHSYHYHHSDDNNHNRTWHINSKVIAASLGKPGMMRLSQPVIVTFRHLQEENMTNPLCVFWDFDLREWSSEGCWVQSSNITHTTCACDHLTNFAVIMEVAEVRDIAVTHDVLHVAITVGCGIAICCLLLTVLPIFILQSLKGDSVTVHRNVFLCLLLTEIVLLGGIEKTWEPIVCAIVAALLDYLLLATICWAFLECFQLYVELADIAQPQKSRWGWYYGLAYTVPGVIVSVAAIVDCQSYGTSRLCWLRADNYFIFSFIGPAVGIFFGGMVFLCVASCILCHHSSLTTTIKGKEEAKLTKIKSNIRRAVLLMCILGLTWTTGLLYLHQETLSLAYAFTVFNSIQGVFIVVFYCVTDEKIQPELERLSQCWLPAHLQRSKGNLPPPAALTPGSPGQHSEECQEPESPTKQGNCSVNLTSTTLGPLYTSSASNQTDEKLPNEAPKAPKEMYGPLQKGAGMYNPNEAVVVNQQESQCKVWLPYEWQRRLDRQYLGTGELYGPFSEHIYESVDGDYGYGGHPRSLAGEYCYRSDISQHSSSSYGYDQRPLLILPRHPGHGDYGASRRYSPDKHRRRHRGHRRSASDKIAGDMTPNASSAPVQDNEVTEVEQGSSEAGEQEAWNLPDLLRCPVDNTVVMAVLDGEKVVSRVQPECPHYNLSTYC